MTLLEDHVPGDEIIRSKCLLAGGLSLKHKIRYRVVAMKRKIGMKTVGT